MAKKTNCVNSKAQKIIKSKQKSGKLHNPMKRPQQIAIAYSEARKHCGVKPYKSNKKK